MPVVPAGGLIAKPVGLAGLPEDFLPRQLGLAADCLPGQLCLPELPCQLCLPEDTGRASDACRRTAGPAGPAACRRIACRALQPKPAKLQIPQILAGFETCKACENCGATPGFQGFKTNQNPKVAETSLGFRLVSKPWKTATRRNKHAGVPWF